MAEQDYDKRLDNLKNDVAELRDLLRSMADELKGGREEGDICMSTLQEGLGRCVGWFKDRAETMKSSSRRAIAKMENRVERRPIASVLTALGIGFVMGRILMRR